MARNPFLELFTEQEQPAIPGTFWATVTGTSPLRVKRDAEPVLNVTPKTLQEVKTGDRVLCLRDNRQLVVLGKLGGGAGDPNTLVIGGTAYQRSGSIPKPTSDPFALLGDALYYTVIEAPIPYTPPSGWTFAWRVEDAILPAWVSTRYRYPAGGTHSLYAFQLVGSGQTMITRLGWELVKS